MIIHVYIYIVGVHLSSLLNIGAVFPFAVYVEDVFTSCTMTHMQQRFFFLSVTSWVEMFCCCQLCHLPELCSAVYFLFSWGTFCSSSIGCWSHADCDSWSKFSKKIAFVLVKKAAWSLLSSFKCIEHMGTRAVVAELLAAEDWEAASDSEDWGWHQTPWTELSVLVQTSFFVSSLSFLLFHELSLQRNFWS